MNQLMNKKESEEIAKALEQFVIEANKLIIRLKK